MGQRKFKFYNHDIRMVFGDLNFRIDCSYQEGVEASNRFEMEDM